MKRILIADASKSSLVITSEVFKDYFPGVQVAFAKTAFDTLEILKNDVAFDAIVVDFDLPDKNGAELAAKIKKIIQVPILMTAFDRPEVGKAILTDLAGYEDCLNWIRKPVKAEVVVNIAQRYCEGKFRTQRRIPCTIPAIFELTVVEQQAVKMERAKKVTPVKGAKVAAGLAKKTPPAAPIKTIRTTKKILISGFVKDSSLGGINLVISSAEVAKLSLGNAAVTALTSMTVGEVLSIQLPKWDTILTSKKISTGAAVINGLPTLKGKIAWIAAGGAENKDLIVWGINAENGGISKKLFEAVLQQKP